MSDPVAELHAAGIRLRRYSAGNHYTTCPQCSASRKGSHKNIPCLSVKIDEAGWVANCHHCSWVDYSNDKRSAHQGHRKAGDQPGTRDVYGALQRQALARWVRRS